MPSRAALCRSRESGDRLPAGHRAGRRAAGCRRAARRLGGSGRHGPFNAGAELADDVCRIPALDGTTAAQAHAVYGSALNSLGRQVEARQHYELALGGRAMAMTSDAWPR
jgi:hypothetical protein